MMLQLYETIYHFKYRNEDLMAVLCIDGGVPCVKYVFENQTIWYLHIKTFKELGQDDLKTVQQAKEIFKTDRGRYINLLMCDFLAENIDNFEFTYKEVLYKFQLHGIDFSLRIIVMNNNVFRMQLTNSSNEDVMTGFCEAGSIRELADNVKVYVDAINTVTTELKDNIGSLINSTFVRSLSTYKLEDVQG